MTRADEEHPAGEAGRDGDDRGVDEAGPVAGAVALAVHEVQAGDQERVAGEVDRVDRPDRRVGVGGQDEQVAGGEGGQAGADQQPRDAVRRASDGDPDAHRGRRGE